MMLPCPIKTLQAPFITRDPETGEVSWPPPQIELELMELGLLPKPAPQQPSRRKKACQSETYTAAVR